MGHKSIIRRVVCVVALAILGVASTESFAISIDDWTCVGDCGALGADGVVTASPASPRYGYVVTGSKSVSNLPPTSILKLTGPAATNGSKITSPTFSASTGQVLSFYYNYVTTDGAGFADFAWARLIEEDGSEAAVLFTARTNSAGNTVPGFNMPPLVATLSPASAPIIPGGPRWKLFVDDSGVCFSRGCGYTGWIYVTYVVPRDGRFKLEFGVSNWRDGLLPSGLAFDGALIGGVPIGAAKSFAENIGCAENSIASLSPPEVTNVAQKNLMLSLLGVVKAYTASHRSLAINALNSVIARTDGCHIRSSVDGIEQGGGGIDFVASCPRQQPIYACLTLARTQLLNPTAP